MRIKMICIMLISNKFQGLLLVAQLNEGQSYQFINVYYAPLLQRQYYIGSGLLLAQGYL